MYEAKSQACKEARAEDSTYQHNIAPCVTMTKELGLPCHLPQKSSKPIRKLFVDQQKGWKWTKAAAMLLGK
jgi:hypothetical protein